MAKAAKIAWGIDVGNCALKAIKLQQADEGVEVLDFAVIEHERILSEPDMTLEDRRKLISKALTSFMEEHDISHSHVVVSVPGQSSFARFIKLPPVEKKRIPELVRYEAIQQIPFNIEDVEWDWQTFQHEESPDIEVGIFAIKRDLVKQALQPFSQLGCMINTVQMAPMALYNFLRYDQKQLQVAAANEAIITLDIGADNTDLIIVDGKRVWQRNIPIGGNQFTAAVQKAFKLSFAKAEAIKRTASTSKYARQIFQAMRTIFADLAAEIQRSLGFYSSANREVQFREVLALGNAMKLPGLVKFLHQSLSLPVKRLDSFESLHLGPEVSVTQFAGHLTGLGVAYGLALQGIGEGVIDINLLPREITRQSAWTRKRKWFIAAVLTFVFAGALSFFHAYAVNKDIQAAEKEFPRINANAKKISEARRELATYQAAQTRFKEEIQKRVKLFNKENLVPKIFKAVYDALPNEKNNPKPEQQKLYEAFKKGDREAVMAIPRGDREQVFITSVQVVYTDDLNQQFDQIVKARTIRERGNTGGPMMGEEGDMMMMEMMMMYGPGAMGPGATGPMPGPTGKSAKRGKGGSNQPGEPQEAVPGFVVVLEGYTPNKGGLSFLNPPEVGMDRSKWGFFKRLEYLGRDATEKKAEKAASTTGLPGANGLDMLATPGLGNNQTQSSGDKSGLPFETFVGSGDRRDYFDVSETGYISGNPKDNQPLGLGIPEPEEPKNRRTTLLGGPIGRQATKIKPLKVLLDPFTYEPISETYVYDDKGNEKLDPVTHKPILEKHDYWFRVKMKIKVKSDKSGTSDIVATGQSNPARKSPRSSRR